MNRHTTAGGCNDRAHPVQRISIVESWKELYPDFTAAWASSTCRTWGQDDFSRPCQGCRPVEREKAAGILAAACCCCVRRLSRQLVHGGNPTEQTGACSHTLPRCPPDENAMPGGMPHVRTGTEVDLELNQESKSSSGQAARENHAVVRAANQCRQQMPSFPGQLTWKQRQAHLDTMRTTAPCWKLGRTPHAAATVMLGSFST